MKIKTPAPVELTASHQRAKRRIRGLLDIAMASKEEAAKYISHNFRVDRDLPGLKLEPAGSRQHCWLVGKSQAAAAVFAAELAEGLRLKIAAPEAGPDFLSESEARASATASTL